jgi:hypothetical protein
MEPVPDAKIATGGHFHAYSIGVHGGSRAAVDEPTDGAAE